MTCKEVRDLLAVLSLDALDVDERDTVEEHVAGCSSCASDLRGYQETAAVLALALPQVDPPAGLKRRILAAAANDHPARQPTWRQRLAARRTNPLALVAALALVIAVGTAFWAAGLQSALAEQRLIAASLQSQLDEQRAIAANNEERAQRYDRVVAVLQAEQTYVRPLQGTYNAPGAYGRVYLDPASGAGMMMVRKLPPLAEGRAYQVWLVKENGQRTPCGLLRRTDNYGNGYTLIQAPVPLSDWQSIGLTEEPATGSPDATGVRMLAGPL